MSIIRTWLAVIPLSLVIGGLLSPAYSQSDSKTGDGPRGTPVAPSTNPSQSGSASTPRPPPGMAKSGTPIARGQFRSSGDANSEIIRDGQHQTGSWQTRLRRSRSWREEVIEPAAVSPAGSDGYATRQASLHQEVPAWRIDDPGTTGIRT